MLHEGVTAAARPHVKINGQGQVEVEERRASPRVPFPAELVIAWFCAMKSPIRYRVLDASEGGFRILSNLPLFEGMTGVAVKLLPDGKPLDRTVMVAWIRTHPDGQHEAGLRLL